MSDPLELELQKFDTVWMLGTKPCSTAEAASAKKSQAISLGHTKHFCLFGNNTVELLNVHLG